MRTLVSVICLLLISSVALSAEEKSTELKSSKGRSAQKKHQRAEKKLNETYQKKLKALRQDYLKDLESAMKEETKRAKLEEAMQIKKEMERVTTLLNPPKEPQGKSSDKGKPSHIVGVWDITFGTSSTRIYTFKEDGTVSFPASGNRITRGTWTKSKSGRNVVYVVRLPSETERITIEDGKLNIEHTYKNRDPIKGIGVRKSK